MKVSSFPLSCMTILALPAIAAGFHVLGSTSLGRNNPSLDRNNNQRNKVIKYWAPLHQAKDFGELSISHPPCLDPELIEASKELLPWEQRIVDDVPAVVVNVEDTHQKQSSSESPVSSSSWQGGEYWFTTRQFLVDMWVLPRDMSNGAWEEYAIAATKGEQKILQQVPQLLRLESQRVKESAITVLRDPLHLPPALLRKEPILLAMEPARLRGAWEQLLQETQKDEKSLMESCKETPKLLVEAGTKWIDPKLSP